MCRFPKLVLSLTRLFFPKKLFLLMFLHSTVKRRSGDRTGVTEDERVGSRDKMSVNLTDVQNGSSRPKSILYQFRNCRLLRDSSIITDDLWVRDGKILNPRTLFWEECINADIQIDCGNLIITPGFIDLQLNGGFGVDFSSALDNVEEGLERVGRGLLQHGVTSFCPTIVTSTEETYKQILPKIKRSAGGYHGAEVLGAHVEGPFINPQKKGAHQGHLMKTVTKRGIEDLEACYGPLDNISIITIAPELFKGQMHVLHELAERGIVVSIGHSMADLSTAEEAARHGTSFITHLFNAMLPFHHRDPGIVGLLTSSDIPKPIFYGLIADGIHTHPTATKIAHKSHAQGLVLVTDAIAALGLPPGEHMLGPMKVDITGNRATVAGTNTLAGSIASMDQCVKDFKAMSGCTLVETLEGATLHPAQVLRQDHKKGTLDYGSDADLVLLDDHLDIHGTFIAGVPVWLPKAGLVTRTLLHAYQLSDDICKGLL